MSVFPILYAADIERSARFYVCIYVEDLDATAERLRALGANEVAPPADQPWGERLAYFDDPDGHRLHVTMSA